MITYPDINPIALNLGFISIHWYGIMYLVGFFLGWLLLTLRVKKQQLDWSRDDLSDLLFYIALGVIIGGRLGYVLFYNFSHYLRAPLNILKLWDGGMSFHGGLLGVTLLVFIFAKKHHRNPFDVADFIVPVVPIGLAAGRIGNFINGELWGRITNVPWAVVYPPAGLLPRHPSQIYEFLLEGILLFTVLWLYSRKSRPRMAVLAWFLILYSILRFIAEFFRQPDSQLGYIAYGWLTMGQILCAPMMLLGIVMLLLIRKTNKLERTA